MTRNVMAVLGALLIMGFAVAGKADAEDYKQFGVRMRAIYVKPDESVDGRLGGAVKLADNVIPELDLEYFFLKNISTELIAGVTKHDVLLNNEYFGSTYLLPPTLTVKYHPFAGNQLSPYVGVGLNVTFPFNSKSNSLDLRIDNSVGWAAQAGIDIRIKDQLYFNIDYKYLQVDTTASLGGEKYDLDINPHLIGMGVGYRF